jgi:hypothetical protein
MTIPILPSFIYADQVIYTHLYSLIDSNDAVRRSVIRTIANITCMDPEATSGVNMVTLMRKNGTLNHLIDYLSSDNNTFAKYSAIAIGNLTCEDSQLRVEVCEKGGITHLMTMASTPSLVANAVSALANITYENETAVKGLVALHGINTFLDIAKKCLKNQTRDGVVILEGILNILANCCTESRGACATMLNANAIPVLVDAIDSRSELMQEHAVRALAFMLVADIDDDYGKLMRAMVAKHGLITPLVLLLGHSNMDIHNNAAMCLTSLRRGEGEMLVPFMETGTVPLLLLLVHTSSDPAVHQFANDMLDWLKSELRGPVLALLVRTLTLDGNAAVRCAIGQSMLCLSMGASHVYSAFVHDGGLASVLNMLLETNNEGAIQSVTDLLVGFEPIADAVYTKFDKAHTTPAPIIDSVILDKASFNNSATSNFTFFVGPLETPFYAHKEVLRGNSDYFRAWFDSNYDIKCLSLPDANSYEIFESAMKHIYFGSTASLLDSEGGRNSLVSGLELIKASYVYNLKALQHVCGLHCSERITPSTSINDALDALEVAINVRELSICIAVYSYMMPNIKSHVKSSVRATG